MKKLLFCLTALLSLTLAGNGDINGPNKVVSKPGNTIKGDGKIISQSFSFSGKGFTSIEVSSRIELRVKQSPTYEVRLETDENIMKHLRLTRKGERLVLDFTDDVMVDPTGSIKMFVAAPAFTRLVTSGSCTVTNEGSLTGPELQLELKGASRANLQLNVGSLEIDASGHSAIDLKGQASKMSIDASGDTDVTAFGLKAGNVEIELSGSGLAQVTAAQSLKVDLSGSTAVEYRGDATLSSEVSGRGHVMKVR